MCLHLIENQERMIKPSPSFFKILIGDFTHQLRLPPVFVKKHSSILSGNSELRITWEGRIWKVEVEQTKDKQFYCLTGPGWTRFAEDADLKIGEILVFRRSCGSTFEVSTYAISGCMREVVPAKESGGGNDVVSKSEECNSSSPLCFEICIKKHHFSRLSLRKGFVYAAGLVGQDHVGLEYLPGNKYQVVHIDHRKEGRTDLTAGWRGFCGAHGIVAGNTYSFEFKPSKNVIQVKQLKTN